MQNADDIVKAYKLADFEGRMFLFLEHRGLRAVFTEIDESELHLDNRLRESRKAQTWLSKLRRAAVIKWSPG
jgi:hypothetical protein